MALAKRSPEIRHASAVRADDMVGSCGIISYWMFSAVKYRCSVGAIDMMDLRCGLQTSHHLRSRLHGKRLAGTSAAYRGHFGGGGFFCGDFGARPPPFCKQ